MAQPVFFYKSEIPGLQRHTLWKYYVCAYLLTLERPICDKERPFLPPLSRPRQSRALGPLLKGICREAARPLGARETKAASKRGALSLCTAPTPPAHTLSANFGPHWL